jgi:hypothetical protein
MPIPNLTAEQRKAHRKAKAELRSSRLEKRQQVEVRRAEAKIERSWFRAYATAFETD